MTDHKQQYVGLWSKQTISRLLRHIWRQNIIFVAIVGIVLGLLCTLLWPLYWESQHKGPTFQIRAQDQVIHDHFGTLQVAVYDPVSIRFTSAGGQHFQACCVDYGDGQLDTVVLAQKPTLTHAYEEAGTYVVSLLIWPTDVNEVPQKQLLGKMEVDCPGKLIVKYTAEIEKDADTFQVQYTSQVIGAPENELTYLWKFGDGTISTKASPLYSYPRAGAYSVSLSITRFLTTSYNCGDTAYQESRLVLGTKNSKGGELNMVSSNQGVPSPRQVKVRMKGWFIAIMGLLLALLGASSFWAGKWIWTHRKQKSNDQQQLKAPGFLSLPRAHLELFSHEKLSVLSQGLIYTKPEDTTQPRYLILIERQTKEDLFARLMEELWTSLKGRGVQVDFFFFQDNPSYYLDPASGQYLPLSSLTAFHGDKHLIICTDGACLIDPYQKGLASWVSDMLAPWSGRQYIFTPIPVEDWEEIESCLTGDFVLCPASQPLILPGCIQTGKYQPADVSRSTRTSWKNGLAYSSTGLQRYLGEPLFRWLQMTALWPQASSDWVMHLGQLFKPEDENFSYNSLIRLARLSWMREGGLPPSLAYRWIANLPEAAEREARELLLHCLEATLPPIGSVAEREKVRFMALQQFLLQPDKLAYAKSIYPLISKSNWNKTAQRLIHRKRKSLHGKSLGEYLHVRLGYMKTLLWSILFGLGTAAMGVTALHAGWQFRSHQGSSEILAGGKAHPIWHTEIWTAGEGSLANLEEIHPEERILVENEGNEKMEEKKVVSADVASVDQAILPCAEKENPLLLVSGRGFSGELWVDKSVLKDVNRLKAYARDNGVEVNIIQAFPASESGTAFGRKMAIGRGFVCSLSYRKGLAWIPCEGNCLETSSNQPRPIRKFLEDLEKDRWWKMDVQSDDSSVQIWLNRFISPDEAKERAYEFAEYWEICGE